LIAMIEKYTDGVIPAVAHDATLESALATAVAAADSAIVALDFQTGINAIMDFCKRVNGYVTEQAPWVLAKDPANRVALDAVLYNTADSIRALAVLLHPVMPGTTQILWRSLGADVTLGPIGQQTIGKVAQWGQLPPGSQVTKGAVLFPRLEEKAD